MTARAPEDPHLPQLPRLLDAGDMADVLRRSLPPAARVSNVRIIYLRYKPGTRLIARYGVTLGKNVHDATALVEPTLDLAGWATDRANVAVAQKVNGRAPTPTPLAYDSEIGALIQWLPLDLTMPTLADDPRDLHDLLRDAGVDITAGSEAPSLLAYKARRRAVLRVDRHVVKLYAGAADFANAVIGLEGAERMSDLEVPQAEAVLPERQLTCQPLLAGKPPQGAHAAASAAGTALEALHRGPTGGLRPFPPGDQLAAAASSARSAAAVVPELRPRLEKLVRELEHALPGETRLVTAHGDFHGNQVLEQEGGLAVIDFDEICAAPAALDFSSYVAHLVNGGPDELQAAVGALDDLVTGYGARPDALSWYVATSIVRRAPFPFRFMDDGWPERIEQLVADAEEALRL